MFWEFLPLNEPDCVPLLHERTNALKHHDVAILIRLWSKRHPVNLFTVSYFGPIPQPGCRNVVPLANLLQTHIGDAEFVREHTDGC
jgi:hypothetical protein